VLGQTLSFTGGSWLYEPALVTDEWGRCASSGVIKTCFTIATTPTYTLTAEDVGSTIRVREKAFNAFGEGVAFSRPTAVVVVSAPSAAGGGGSVPASAPVANAAVSGAVAWTASTAQLKALLMRLLVPRGKAAKVATLRKRGYSTAFASLAAGRLAISWYYLPKGARSSAAKRPKPVLFASGKLTTGEGGTAKLTMRFTSAGRALLKQGKPVKLTAKGAFAPKGRPTLKATRSFALSR
jgi:hypothetical protein